MIAPIFHAYNAAPPKAKRTARAAVAFLAGAALAVLATSCSPACALPNQPQTHVQKAQAATEKVAKVGAKGGHHGL